MAWPASDSFANPHLTSMHLKMDDSGNQWQLTGGGTNCQILNSAGQERAFCNTGGASQVAHHQNGAVPPSPDYRVGGVVRCMTDNESSSYVMVVRSINSNNYYGVRFQTDATPGYNMRLQKNLAGVQTDMATFLVPELTVGDTAELVAQIEGNVLSAYWKGALIGSVADGANSFPLAGLPGWRHGGISSSSIGLHLEEWFARDIGAAAATIDRRLRTGTRIAL